MLVILRDLVTLCDWKSAGSDLQERDSAGETHISILFIREGTHEPNPHSAQS